MIGTVRVPRKVAVQVLALADKAIEEFGLNVDPLVEALRQALRPSEEKRDAKKRNAGEKKATAWKVRDMTAAIKAAVTLRASGVCEACGGEFSAMDPPDLDHVLGRGKGRPLQAIGNTWLIHRSCHRARHDARPSAEHWRARMVAHCQRYGYSGTEAQINALREARALTRGGNTR